MSSFLTNRCMLVRFVPVAVVLGVAFLLGSGCSGAAKKSALTVVQEMDAAIAEREDARRVLVESLATQYFDQVKKRIEAQRVARRDQAILEIYKQADALTLTLATEAAAQLEATLEPLHNKLLADLTAERKKIADGTGSRERELNLAASLATQLATEQREADRLRRRAVDLVSKIRDERIRELEQRFAGLEVDLDPATEASKIVREAEAEEGRGEFELAMSKGFQSIRDYIQLEDPVSLALRGLVGDKLGATIIDKLKGAAEGKLKDIESSLEEFSKGAEIERSDLIESS